MSAPAEDGKRVAVVAWYAPRPTRLGMRSDRVVRGLT